MRVNNLFLLLMVLDLMNGLRNFDGEVANEVQLPPSLPPL